MSTTDLQREYLAYGERKTLSEWALDSRCPITRLGLIYRIKVRNMTIEEAFAEGGIAKHKHLRVGFGERKSLGEWFQDPRCSVTRNTLYKRVLERGMTIEQAFAYDPTDPANRSPLRMTNQPITAWGETRTAEMWAADPRAKTSAKYIAIRIRNGTAPEDAISKTTRELCGHALRQRLHEAYGDRKNLSAWSRDPRCPVTRWGLHFRVLKMGMTVEQAFELGPHDSTRKRVPEKGGLRCGRKPHWPTITAWGETKTPQEWSMDPRATVSASLIVVRMRRGYAPEDAISLPKSARHGPERFPACPVVRVRQSRS